MTDNLTPFDARPDETLGALLRAELEGSDAGAFVARLRAVLAKAERRESWDVLAGWARPSVVAAGLAAAALLWVVLTRDVGPPLGPGGVPAQELIAAQPTGEVLISAVLEGR